MHSGGLQLQRTSHLPVTRLNLSPLQWFLLPTNDALRQPFILHHKSTKGAQPLARCPCHQARYIGSMSVSILHGH